MRKVFIKEYPWDHHECWEGKEAEVGRGKEPKKVPDTSLILNSECLFIYHSLSTTSGKE